MTPDRCRRTTDRFQVQWPVYYSNGEFHASGLVQNLSGVGGRVSGSHPVNIGMSLIVFVIPPVPHGALLIRRATVRWANDRAFGVELSDLPPATQSELARLAVL